jgi:CRISPR system Cascade subunit CasC
MQMAENLNIGTRTRHVLDLLVDSYYDQGGTGEQDAVRKVFSHLVSEALSNTNDNGRTANTLYLGPQEIKKAVSLVQKAALDLQGDPDEWGIESLAESWSTHVEVAPVPADVACFGRMVAADPERWNVEAAVQVAHAVATHRLQSEIDYFAAVDDVEERASYLGTQDLQTAVFYRFIALDVPQLRHNLGGDIDLMHRTVRELLNSIAVAVPEGGLSNSGHYNRPALLLARVNSQPINLLPAFDTPVRATRNGLIKPSIRRLEQYLMEQEAVWGAPNVRGQYTAVSSDLSEALEGDLLSNRVENLSELIEHVLEDVGVQA